VLPARRVIIARLLVGALLLLSLAACDFQSKYFRKVDLAETYRYLAPYDGFNLEMNLAGIDIGFFPTGDWGAGLEAVDINLFYSLALGGYLHASVPMFKASEPSGLTPGWFLSGGLIYQPVASWALKPYIKVGAAGLQWTAASTNRWTPALEASIGIATAFNYRAALDFWVARDLSPDKAHQDPWIMAVRINLIGFSLVSFKPEREVRDRGKHIGDELR